MSEPRDVIARALANATTPSSTGLGAHSLPFGGRSAASKASDAVLAGLRESGYAIAPPGVVEAMTRLVEIAEAGIAVNAIWGCGVEPRDVRVQLEDSVKSYQPGGLPAVRAWLDQIAKGVSGDA